MIGPPKRMEMPIELPFVFLGKVTVRAVLNLLAARHALLEDDFALQTAELKTQVELAEGVDKEETDQESDHQEGVGEPANI